jgi:diaminopimelate decarboxylase
MHQFEYRRGTLFCEDADLGRVAETHGTPCYVYSANTIRDHYRRLDAALEALDHTICYAVKANSSLAILNLLVREGAGFDIVSTGELHRVLKAGGDAGRCTFAGVGKTDDEIRYALAKGIYCFNVESESELEAISRVARAARKKAPVALRVNPDVEAETHKYISTGKSENKFGIGWDRIPEVYKLAEGLPGIRICGVQMHIESQILKPDPFARAVEKMAPLVADLKTNHAIEFFSVGGGIGIVYEGSLSSGGPGWWEQVPEGVLTLDRYADAIAPPLKSLGLKILFEPGRFMVGNAGVLLCRVVHLKETGSKSFAIVDAGMNDLIRPALYEGRHEIVPVIEPDSDTTRPVDVVGPICESGDFLAQGCPLPPVSRGDYLAVMSAGAYGFTMASNYNSRPLVPELLVDGAEVFLARKRQTLADLIRGERIPETR